MRRAEALLHRHYPQLNLDDPSLDQILDKNERPAAGQRHDRDVTPERKPQMKPPDIHEAMEAAPNLDLESMMHATGQLDIDERGYWDYHGHSSGLSFIRRMGEEFRELGGEGPTGIRIPKSQGSAEKLKLNRMSPLVTLADSPSESNYFTDELPEKDTAKKLCYHALDEACAMVMCVHQPSFYRSFDRIYEIPFEQYENQDHSFLPLLYAVLGLGCLFADDEDSDLQRSGYQSATDRGYGRSPFHFTSHLNTDFAF